MKQNRLWPDGPMFAETPHAPLTTDSILLADFASARPGERGADLGCASGALMLLLLWREPKLNMTGLELLPEAVELAEENLRANSMEDRAKLLCGDLRETVKQLPNAGFDFVISNPPYFTEEQGAVSPERQRAAARGETTLRFSELCRAASRLCRSGGRIYLCHRPERLPVLLQEMREARLEPKRLRFVHHSATAGAGLVLIEARKDGRPGLTVDNPFVIRNENGQESGEYRRICHIG